MIIASYLLIGLVTGDYSTSITGTVLVLLGVSAGTAAGAAIVDASRPSPGPVAEAKREAALLDAEKKLAHKHKEIETQLAAVKAAPHSKTEQAKLAELEREQKLLDEEIRSLRNESFGWLIDILSDANGVNFQRFQMAVWTVVLGIVFAVHVHRELAMPQFSEALLALMGISAATYVGLKIAEPSARRMT